jgi:hypothetical protein
MSWKLIFELIILISIGAFMVHLVMGNVMVAATHFVIGLLAAVLRGAGDYDWD